MNFQFSLLDFLSKDDFIVYNKKLAHTIGINETILFMDLVSKYRYFLNKWWIDNEWYFYNTAENINKDTALSQFQQQKALKVLIKLWFITTKLKWLPSTKHFRISFDTIDSLFKSTSDQSFQQNWKLVCNKVKNNVTTKSETSFQLNKEQVSYKVVTNNNKHNNKHKNNEWLYTHSQNIFLLEWNRIMNKNDIITSKASKVINLFTMPIDDFKTRCKNCELIVTAIKENKLQNFIFYKVYTYDFGKFLDNINIFEWTVEEVLEKIVNWNDSLSLNKIKKYINPPKKTTKIKKEEIPQKVSLIELEEKVKNILPSIKKDIQKQTLEKFINKIKWNKIFSIYYQKWWIENPMIKGMYYNYLLDKFK